jgi:hypothetical protein
VAHEYPDFYLRDSPLKQVLRMEMKAVDADSDEQAARFDVLTREIDPARDLVLFVAWEWVETRRKEGSYGEHPNIFAHLVLPAIEIARERDRRLIETGGRVTDEGILVPSKKKPGQHVPDPGNYGKLLRIVHASRRGSEDLSDGIRRFVQFLHCVEEHAKKRAQ